MRRAAPGRGAAHLRLGAHSPVLPASGPWLSLQGPKLFLRRVLVSEETEGKDREGRKAQAQRDQGSESSNPGLESGEELDPKCMGTGWAGAVQGQGKALDVGWGLAGGRDCSEKLWDKDNDKGRVAGEGRSWTPLNSAWHSPLSEKACAWSCRKSSQFPPDLRKGPRSKQGQKAWQETDL